MCRSLLFALHRWYEACVNVLLLPMKSHMQEIFPVAAIDCDFELRNKVSMSPLEFMSNHDLANVLKARSTQTGEVVDYQLQIDLLGHGIWRGQKD